MTAIAPITVEALPGYTGMDGENADNYYRANQRKAFVTSEIVGPFEDALKEFTDYSDDNIPDDVTEIQCDVGGHEFLLTATPSKKRPGYREVFDEVYGFLHTRADEYKAGERPVGILTIDDQPYVSANDVLAMINKMRRRVSDKGVKISINERPELPADAYSLVVPLGMDLAELSEGNAGRYLTALRMLDDYASIISGFEGELLGMTGYNDEHPPEQTEHMFRQVGGHIFHVKSVPYENTSWGKVIDGLGKKPGKKDPSTGGDLVLVTKDIEVPRLSVYNVRQRNGDSMVRLKALLKRMDGLVDDNTATKVRQKPIVHYPLV